MFWHVVKITVFLGFGVCAAAFVAWFLCCLVLAVVTGLAMDDEDVERDYSVGRDVK